MMSTTSTTTTANSTSDHEIQLPPLPPPPPPPLPHHHRHRLCHVVVDEDVGVDVKVDVNVDFHPCSKEPTPSSISTSPASSHEELQFDHLHHHLPTTAATATATTTAANNHAMNSSHHYKTPPQYIRKTPTSTSTSTPTASNRTEDELIDLIELASTTLASTIIASKVIQKHSTLLSSHNNRNTTSNFSMSQSSIQSDYQPGTTTTSEQQHPQQQQQQQPQPQQPQQLPKSRTKDDGTIVTDADGESQRIITSYIKSISTQIRIVGEETNDEIQISQKGYHRKTWWGISPGSKRKLLCKEKQSEEYICDLVTLEIKKRCREQQQQLQLHLQQEQNDSTRFVHPERISIYVDPLDGTGAYAKGQYEAVTILVGIMLDNVPIFGIIVKPFGHQGCNVDFDIGAYHHNQHHHQHHHQPQPHSRTTSNTILQKYLLHQRQTINGNHGSNLDHLSSLGFLHPCSALYGGTLLGGAFIFSGEELSRSLDYRTKGSSDGPSSSVDIPPPSSALLDIKESISLSSSITSTEQVEQDPSNNSKNEIHNEDTQRKAIISKSKGGGVVKQCINSLSSKGLLHPEPIYITGAGYKTMRLLLGTHNETMWFFPKPGTSLWDVAAADALLRVMGGRLSDKFGGDLDYSRSWTDADNLDGIVACSDVDLHAKCIKLYHDECWDDEDR